MPKTKAKSAPPASLDALDATAPAPVAPFAARHRAELGEHAATILVALGLSIRGPGWFEATEAQAMALRRIDFGGNLGDPESPRFQPRFDVLTRAEWEAAR